MVGDDAVGIRRPREGAVHGEGDPVARFFQKRLDEVTLQHDVAERDERARAEITLGQGERIGLTGRGEVRIVYEACPGNVDGLRAVAADNHRVPSAERGEVVEEPRQDGPALHPEHGLRHPRGEAAEVRAFARGEDHRGERFTRGQIAALGLRQLRVTLQAKDLVERGHLRLHGEQRIIRAKPARRLLHGADGRPQQMVRPDHHADLPRAEILRRGAPVRGRHEHHGQAIAPLREEGEDLGRARLLRVDENGVGARRVIGLRALERLRQTPARDERLHAGDEHEVGVLLAVLARLDLAGELRDIGERLELGAEERIGLREELVLDHHPAHADLLQLPHEAPHVVEVAVARVTVEEHGDGGRLGHEGDVLDHLGPAQLVVVTDAEGGGQGEAARPDPLEAGFLHDARGEAVVSLHHEGDLGSRDELAEPGGRAHGLMALR